MDIAIQELGSSVKPVNRPLRGAVHPVSIKRKAGTSYILKTFQPYRISSALAVLPKISSVIPKTGCGQRPHSRLSADA